MQVLLKLYTEKYGCRPFLREEGKEHLESSRLRQANSSLAKSSICWSPLLSLLVWSVIAVHMGVLPIFTIIDAPSAWAAWPAVGRGLNFCAM